jgi:hypothetical protein
VIVVEFQTVVRHRDEIPAEAEEPTDLHGRLQKPVVVMIDDDVVERANLFLLLVADAAADQTSGRTRPGRDIFGPMLLLVFMLNSSNVARCRAGCALREVLEPAAHFPKAAPYELRRIIGIVRLSPDRRQFLSSFFSSELMNAERATPQG